MDPSAPHDFGVYAQKKPTSIVGSGKVAHHFEDEHIGLTVNELVKQRILAIPRLEKFRIYDAPYKVCSIYWHTDIPDSEHCWYVSYSCYTALPPFLGPGPLLILDRESAEVYYDGTDGCE